MKSPNSCEKRSVTYRCVPCLSTYGEVLIVSEFVDLDALVRQAIAEGFPTQTFPDENNRLPTGLRFKAPDHSLLDGKILVERKSRYTVDRSQFHDKLQQIAAKQGVRFEGYGTSNLGRVLDHLP